MKLNKLFLITYFSELCLIGFSFFSNPSIRDFKYDKRIQADDQKLSYVIVCKSAPGGYDTPHQKIK